MAKWFLDAEEWYPVLGLLGHEYSPGCYGNAAEFSDEEIADLRRIGDEFSAWQYKIAERFGKSSMANSYSLVDGASGVLEDLK